MKKKFLKTNKGITLIALIITIIVLVILAVVAINSIKNDGIIEHAQSAKTKHQIGQEKESISLAVNEAYLIGKGRITKESLQSALSTTFKDDIQYTDTTSNEFIKIRIESSKREYKVYLNGTLEGPLGEVSGGEGGGSGEIVTPPADDTTIEISVTEPVVVDVSGNKQIEAGSITSGSLYIQFKPTIESGKIDSVKVGETTVTSEADGTYKYEVTENGTYEFDIKGTANGTEYTKTVSVTVNQFKVEEIKTLAELVEPSNYGDTIIYSANGIEDWKIFYNDGTNVFIITSNCVPYEKIPQSAKDLGITQNGTTGIYWTNLSDREMSNINKTITDKFMAGWVMGSFSDELKTERDVKMGSDLLNTDIWADFVSTQMKQNGALAIGSPTAEMWAQSWNDKGNVGLRVIYASEYIQNYDSTWRDGLQTGVPCRSGYSFGDMNGLTWIQQKDAGYSDNLYKIDSNYILSSILVNADERNTLGTVESISETIWAFSSGSLTAARSQQYGIRPVVCLPANAIATEGVGTWTNLGLAE